MYIIAIINQSYTSVHAAYMSQIAEVGRYFGISTIPLGSKSWTDHHKAWCKQHWRPYFTFQICYCWVCVCAFGTCVKYQCLCFLVFFLFFDCSLQLQVTIVVWFSRSMHQNACIRSRTYLLVVAIRKFHIYLSHSKRFKNLHCSLRKYQTTNAGFPIDKT